MKYTCGPDNNVREISISLPNTPETIGVFVSGGLDSAILYFLLVDENIRTGNMHTIIPFTVPRKEGSKYFAKPVVEYVQMYFGLPIVPPYEVGNNTLYEPLQVGSGMKVAYLSGCNTIYAGLITQLPEHMVGWDHPTYQETAKFKAPFLTLNKSHVVDLIYKVNQECLFHITHSCDFELGRCMTCNGCNERDWGFRELGISDPGRM